MELQIPNAKASGAFRNFEELLVSERELLELELLELELELLELALELLELEWELLELELELLEFEWEPLEFEWELLELEWGRSNELEGRSKFRAFVGTVGIPDPRFHGVGGVLPYRVKKSITNLFDDVLEKSVVEREKSDQTENFL